MQRRLDMAERKRKPKPNPEMEQLAQSLIAAMASQQDGYNASDVYETMQEGLKLAMERLMQTELTDFLGYQIYNDVDEFLIHYSTQQTIPYTFFKKLVEHRNFALITILISTANYGVTDIPDDLALRGLDPVVKGGYYSNNNAFERFNTGKNAYAYPPVGSSEPINGGLGIAHFDDSHYLEFYKTFGYPEHCDINDLLYKTDSNNKIVPLENKDAYLTSNTQTSPLLVSNLSLVITNKDKIHPKTYDNSRKLGYSGVKNNKFWQIWASKIVSSRIRQQYLFHYRKEHFWNSTLESYSNESKRNPSNQNISLQNVIRSARAKNSGVALDPTLSPELLYNRYSSDITDRNERRIIQKMNIKRAIVLIEYILSNETSTTTNKKNDFNQENDYED